MERAAFSKGRIAKNGELEEAIDFVLGRGRVPSAGKKTAQRAAGAQGGEIQEPDLEDRVCVRGGGRSGEGEPDQGAVGSRNAASAAAAPSPRRPGFFSTSTNITASSAKSAKTSPRSGGRITRAERMDRAAEPAGGRAAGLRKLRRPMELSGDRFRSWLARSAGVENQVAAAAEGEPETRDGALLGQEELSCMVGGSRHVPGRKEDFSRWPSQSARIPRIKKSTSWSARPIACAAKRDASKEWHISHEKDQDRTRIRA